MSFRNRPAQASLLHAKTIPPVGGDTIFADQAAAYDALSEGMKAILAPLFAWHDFEVAARTQYAKPVVVEGIWMGLIAHGIHWFAPSLKQGAKPVCQSGLYLTH